MYDNPAREMKPHFHRWIAAALFAALPAARARAVEAPTPTYTTVGDTTCMCPGGYRNHRKLAGAASCQIACFGSASASSGGSAAQSAASAASAADRQLAAQLGQAIGAGIVDMFKQAAAADA